jgi:hypothetical protein
MEQRIRRLAYKICEIKASHSELIQIATLLASGKNQSDIERQLGLKPRTLSMRLKRTSVCVDLIKVPDQLSARESQLLESNLSWRLWPFGYRPEAHYSNRSTLVGARYVAFGPRDPSLNSIDWQDEANKSAKLDAKSTLASIERLVATKYSTKTGTSTP